MELDIARAWKDEVYYQSLSDEQKALVPSNPAGEVELTEEDLLGVVGGMMNTCGFNCFCVTMIVNPMCRFPL
ncbi:MAG: mersacidin/lichenicidin family type 2 lantibiotic [Ktedonobacteraceae bacterium]|nr:mersacidin/lichenicidin family type 2 lantibiotic [Ktedonobacteraceae bacterium]